MPIDPERSSELPSTEPVRWPVGFDRIPRDEDWTRRPVEWLARKYDSVENHGWYDNLDRTVEQLDGYLRDGDVVLDYSSGTGILAARLLEEIDDRAIRLLLVDSSPKFLRLALDKLGDDPRTAFRLIRYLKEEGRLERIEEVVERPMLDRGVEAIVSTNAIHLYYDLPETLESWADLLRPGCRAFVQSGNIGLPDLAGDRWIIDQTIAAIHEVAVELVRADDRWRDYRSILDDPERMAAYEKLRNKYFLPVRPLTHYVERLSEAGFEDLEVERRPVEVDVEQWLEFLRAYHEGILGWVGGAEKVEGEPADDEAVEDRLELLAAATRQAFEGRDSFTAVWTYVTCTVPGPGGAR